MTYLLYRRYRLINATRGMVSSHIINNSISPYIKEAGYVLNDFKADFITIRPLDQSKYAIDLV